MKKILLLLILVPLMAISQTIPADATALENLQITNNTTSPTAPFVTVQETNGVMNKINKVDLVNVVEVNDVPSLPLIGEVGKIYVVKNVNKIYRWNGTFYQGLAVTDITYQSIIDALGYAPENVVNKSTSLTSPNNTTYPTTQLLKDQLDLKANDLDVLHKTGDETKTGVLTLDNLKLPFNPIGSSLYRISGSMADSDTWSIYGSETGSDNGEMVFEVGDNGNERFRFHFEASAGGINKDPLIINYNSSIFNTDLGIGTTTPPLTKLHVNENSSNPVYGTFGNITGAALIGVRGIGMASLASFSAGSSLSFGQTDLSTFNEAMRITGNVVRVNNLSGLGDRVVSANTSGELSISSAPTAPTAAPGTNTTQIATTAFVQAVARPYKVYTALLSQSGTNAPVATVLENTLGGAVVWGRIAAGQYIGTLTGAFAGDKTISFFQSGSSSAGSTYTYDSHKDSNNSVRLYALSNGAFVDQIIAGQIEIRVYN